MLLDEKNWRGKQKGWAEYVRRSYTSGRKEYGIIVERKICEQEKGIIETEKEKVRPN